jgi:hypothetical protein
MRYFCPRREGPTWSIFLTPALGGFVPGGLLDRVEGSAVVVERRWQAAVCGDVGCVRVGSADDEVRSCDLGTCA